MFLTMFNPFAPGADRIDPVEAITMVKNGKAVLVDVREANEFAGGRAKGAINLPMGDLARRADPASPACEPALKNGRAVILYCASGARSGMAGKMFRKFGHESVFDLGGLNAWANAGGKLER
ncbi:rhodanese-like domain-containing protein [Tropicimonas sp. IMCC6043]|uniref:rhodanese-like domain-containing protein n=1 Tax=Tropicimonas sp. IMCC6043 TaxID=2510645 RepID=UPI00101BA339|nr:rhodanese-like domain-containing protein [Tropicimonas sp. IMCC6043]RYH09056.1 rhodanese-like domain-containing protein [Tropicimonas sp. IMCC6043]